MGIGVTGDAFHCPYGQDRDFAGARRPAPTAGLLCWGGKGRLCPAPGPRRGGGRSRLTPGPAHAGLEVPPEVAAAASGCASPAPPVVLTEGPGSRRDAEGLPPPARPRGPRRSAPRKAPGRPGDSRLPGASRPFAARTWGAGPEGGGARQPPCPFRRRGGAHAQSGRWPRRRRGRPVFTAAEVDGRRRAADGRAAPEEP